MRYRGARGAVAPLAGALTGAVLLAGPSAGPVAAQAVPGPEQVVTISDPRIAESSGLALSPAHRDLVWTVNDSGSAAVVYGVSTRDGRTRAVLTLQGADGRQLDARDMEAMAAGHDPSGRALLWVGDTGDNRAVRSSVVLRLLAEPSTVRSQRVRTVSLRVRYPGGPADAETLIWTADHRLLIVTKALLSAQVYQVPASVVRRALAGQDVSEPALAQQVSRIPLTLATDGTALPDGRVIVRGYGSATVYEWVDGALQAGEQLELPAQQQGETMTAERSGTTVLVGSEGEREPLWRVRVPARTPASALPSADPSAGPMVATRTDAAPRPTGAAATARVSFGTALAGVGLAVVLLAGAAAALRGARRRGRRTP